MPGVRDEAPLLFIALGDRLDDSSGEQQDQAKDCQQAKQGDAAARKQERAEGGETSSAIEENHPDSHTGGLLVITVIPNKSPLPAAFQNALGIFERGCRIHSGDLSGIRRDDIAGSVQQNGKVSGFIRRFRR